MLRRTVVVQSVGQVQIVEDMVPTVKPDTMLCRVKAVALNPADVKILHSSPKVGAVVGFDFAGEVVEVGSEVRRFRVGDRILGLAHGFNCDDKTSGAFADYVLATEHVSCKIPPSMTYEMASSIGLAVAAVGCALYANLGLTLPRTQTAGDSDSNNPQFVLVAGGASSTGSMAIQLLKLSGLRPIATCSSDSMKFVASLGAVQTFDYKLSNCTGAIRSYTDGSLAYAIDCITSTETMAMCYEAIGSNGGQYVGLNPISPTVKYTRRDVISSWLMATTVFGGAVKLGGVFNQARNLNHYQLAKDLYPLVEDFLLSGAIHVPQIQIQTGGIIDVVNGVKELGRDTLRRKKLVISLSEINGNT